MPYRRLYRRPRRLRRIRRKLRKPRIKRSFPLRIYNFKRQCDLAVITTVAGVSPALFTYTFKLSDCASGDFANLFDQYRIRAIKVVFYPASNMAWTGSGQSSAPLGEFFTVIDYDDSNVESIDGLNQFQTLKRSYFNRPHKRYFRPMTTQSGVYQSGAVTTAYRSLPNYTWFDMASRDILYYGIKGAYDVAFGTSMQAQTIKVRATYYFQCRMVR